MVRPTYEFSPDEPAIDRWLRNEAAPAYKALKALRSRGGSLQDARAALAERHERTTKSART
jgi:hypothetical protein